MCQILIFIIAIGALGSGTDSAMHAGLTELVRSLLLDDDNG